MNDRHGLIEPSDAPAIAIEPVEIGAFAAWRERQNADRRRWLDATGFKAERGSFSLLPAEGGGLGGVLLAVGGGEGEARQEMWDWAGLPTALPPRRLLA